jgi:hypothetical protein
LVLASGSGRNGTRIEIPLVVVLWENANFGGRKRVFVDDDADLSGGTTTRDTAVCQGGGDQRTCYFDCKSGVDFNDTASALGVHPGPDYASFVARTGRQPTVTVYTDAGFGGRAVRFPVGVYGDFGALGLNDAISSLAIDDPTTLNQIPVASVGSPAPFNQIPFVVKLHSASLARRQACQEAETVITLVESSADLGGDYGFADRTSRVELLGGTAGRGAGVRVYSGAGYAGNSIASSTIGDWPVDTIGFNDVTRSVKINGPLRIVLH